MTKMTVAIKKNIEAKTNIERSKFFSFSFRVESLEDFNLIVKEYKSKFSSATHVCYGGCVDDGGLKYFYDDDKEPSGTAGWQLVNLLKEKNIVNTLIIVARFFGGIKLGIPGLSRAYKESGENVLKDLVEVEKQSLFKVTCDYNSYNNLLKTFEKEGKTPINTEFLDKVSFEIYLKDDKMLQNLDYVALDKEKYCEKRGKDDNYKN